MDLLLLWYCSAIWLPWKIQEGTGMLSVGIIVYRDREAKKKTERNNAGKLEPGYSAQFDAAASNRHEQEKSIRPTRLLSKGLPPWERVERIKAFGKKQKKKVAEEESELKWQFVVFFVRSAASDLKITFILSFFIPGMLIIPDTFPSLFFFFFTLGCKGVSLSVLSAQ